MLYDGAIRFAEQGRIALAKRDFDASYNALTRAQKIVIELVSTLKHEAYPELCAKLSSLYNYAHRNLVEANVKHRVESVDEAVKVLRYQRETWAMLMDQLGKDKAAEAARQLDIPAPDERMEASISMQG